MNRFVMISSALFTFAASGAFGSAYDAPDSGLPALIPRSVLFSNPARTAPQISPDGKSIALLRPSAAGVSNLWVRPLSVAKEKMVTADGGNGIFSYTWSADSRRLLYFQDRQGDEVQHLFCVELKTGMIRDLTPFQGVRAQNLITSPGKPGEVLVGLNLRDARVFDMYRIDLETGAVKLDTKNPGDVLSWNADQRLVIRACSAMDPKDASTSIRTRSSGKAAWRTIFTVPFEESLQIAQQNGGTSIVGFSPSGRSLYVVTAKGGDTSRLLRIDAANGRVRETVTPARGADIEVMPDALGEERFAVVADPRLAKIQAVGYNYQDLEWKVQDATCQDDFDALSKYRLGDFSVVSKDAEDRRWVVSFYAPNLPTLFAVYDRKTKEFDRLFEDCPDLGGFELAQTKSIAIRARDDLKLVAYLTLPPGVEGKKLPMVLMPHGGPWHRDRWQFDPTVQLLANRGYAVLQVNFRGSVGYGVKFLNAGNGGWGRGAMQNDLTDAVNWAMAQGIADPERVAIMGGSYGGYATLAGVAFTPKLYACAIDLVGPSDVTTLVDSIPSYWAPIKRRWVRRIGAESQPADFLRSISPVHHAVEIRCPLLIVHGANDPRVKLAHSEAIVKAVRERGGEATFVVYPDEGHGIARPENAIDLTARIEEFLAKHLGGRSEGLAEVKGSSVEVR